MNQIVFELCPEDRARLDAIITGLSNLSAAPAAPAPAPAPAAPADPADPAEGSAPTAAPVDLAEFQKAITVRCAESPEIKKAVKAIVNRYAASVSTIPADKRSEVLAELAKI